MSTKPLTFLYPHLFRALRTAENPATITRQCRAHTQRTKVPRRAIGTSSQRNQQFAPRHGKAVEPIEQPGDIKDGAKVAGPETLEQSDSPSGRKNLEQDAAAASKPKEKEAPPPPKEPAGPDLSSSAPLSKETQAASILPGDIGSSWLSPEEKAEKRRSDIKEGRAPEGGNEGQPPVATVLHMDPPLEKPPQDSKGKAEGVGTGNPELPHLVPPPYVHHFDSYTLVKRIEEGGFTPVASIELMKVVRGLLAENLDVAQHGLVSKSDVENETYLFQAACSELRTEISNARKANDEKMRMQRTILQHEVDILNQKLTQDLASLKDDLRGMFNDRKMEVRMEQRSMESAIQEINYKITVALNSDSKSEVEGVRWILTRRSVLAIVFMAVVVLSSLRYASYRSHAAAQKQKEAEKLAEQEKQRKMNVKMSEGGTQTEEILMGAEGLSST